MKSPRGSNLLLRTAVVIVMALAIGAPTPGRISGCSTGPRTGVDPRVFCEAYENRVCARDLATGALDDAGHGACVGEIDARCSGFNFPAGCEPTESTAQACYGALIDVARLSTPANELPECNVCSGSGGGIDPEGI